MARICTMCHKSSSGVWRLTKLRGKYNPSIKTRKRPNLQWARLASGKRIMVCANCIKTLGKKKRIALKKSGA